MEQCGCVYCLGAQKYSLFDFVRQINILEFFFPLAFFGLSISVTMFSTIFLAYRDERCEGVERCLDYKRITR